MTLSPASMEISRHGYTPFGFNDSFLVTPPKGQHEGDHVEVKRLAGETRPLSLRNTDAKLIASASVVAFRTVHKEWTDPH